MQTNYNTDSTLLWTKQIIVITTGIILISAIVAFLAVVNKSYIYFIKKNNSCILIRCIGVQENNER